MENNINNKKSLQIFKNKKKLAEKTYGCFKIHLENRENMERILKINNNSVERKFFIKLLNAKINIIKLIIKQNNKKNPLEKIKILKKTISILEENYEDYNKNQKQHKYVKQIQFKNYKIKNPKNTHNNNTYNIKTSKIKFILIQNNNI